MINRTHPSDLARFRHTDFGYFAGGVADTSGRGLGTVPDKRGLNSVVGSERLTGQPTASIKRKQGRGGGRW